MLYKMHSSVLTFLTLIAFYLIIGDRAPGTNSWNADIAIGNDQTLTESGASNVSFRRRTKFGLQLLKTARNGAEERHSNNFISRQLFIATQMSFSNSVNHKTTASAFETVES